MVRDSIVKDRIYSFANTWISILTYGDYYPLNEILYDIEQLEIDLIDDIDLNSFITTISSERNEVRVLSALYAKLKDLLAGNDDREYKTWINKAVRHLYMLTDLNFRIFLSDIKNIKIISNRISYGLLPNPEDEVEQHVSINNSGDVFVDRFAYGKGRGEYKKK